MAISTESLRRATERPIAGPALTVLGGMVGFVGVALLGFQVVDAGSGLVAIWPPNGLIVALFVLLPPRLRPWVLLGVLPGELIADSIHGYPLVATLGFSVTDLLESALAGVVLLKLAGRTPRGDRQRDFYALFVAAGIAPAACGLLGAGISHAQWGSPFATSLLLWWLGDMIGILLVVTATLSISRRSPRGTPASHVGAVIEIAIAVAASLAVFGLTTLPVMFAVLAPLTLLAIRHSLRTTAVAIMAFAATATVMTGRGHGPLAHLASITERVVILQTFVALASFIVFLISATMAEQRHAKAELTDLATHDPLTGIGNRRLLLEQLERAAARAGRSVQSSAIIYFDLDSFKEINDRLGHAVGDAVLVEVGRRLASGARGGDVVARMGGDEFAALVEPVDGIEGAAACARRISHLIEQPFSVDGVMVSIQVSVGTALITPDLDVGLRQADEELYRDKRTAHSPTTGPGAAGPVVSITYATEASRFQDVSVR